MLCVSNAALPDWPLGDRREVDPKNERIAGLLRARLIVALVPPRRAPETPPKRSEAPDAPQVVEAAEAADASTRPPTRRRRAADA